MIEEQEEDIEIEPKKKWTATIEIEAYEEGDFGIKLVDNGDSQSRLLNDPGKAWEFYRECVCKVFERIKRGS